METATKQPEVKARSEAIEPAFQHMMGVMGMRYLNAKEKSDETGKPEDFRDTVERAWRLWAILDTINLQTIFLDDAVHASIAIGNEMRKIANMIEGDLGIDPYEFKPGTDGDPIHLNCMSEQIWIDRAFEVKNA